MTKYKAVPTYVDGIRFASKKEAKRYQELKLLESKGVIKNLRLQVPFTLIEKSKYGKAVLYYADFVYAYEGQEVVEDAKGYETPVFKLKERLMKEVNRIIIHKV